MPIEKLIQSMQPEPPLTNDSTGGGQSMGASSTGIAGAAAQTTQ